MSEALFEDAWQRFFDGLKRSWDGSVAPELPCAGDGAPGGRGIAQQAGPLDVWEDEGGALMRSSATGIAPEAPEVRSGDSSGAAPSA